MPDQTDRIDRQIRNANIHAPKMAVSDLQAAKAEYDHAVQMCREFGGKWMAEVLKVGGMLHAAYEAELLRREVCGGCKHVGRTTFDERCYFETPYEPVGLSARCKYATPDNPHGRWEGVR